ncbi:asparaginase [uncultured Bifidobacterium sp.]|uniref:asparaginase n=1 Tax=uncultured Bifidobacterium sp. TaxID=165187 RepID=UPI002639866A|nr:asparaginase [uncultured Bifidobacterium sp.]
MTRIHVTYTGGTIGMVESAAGLVPGADLSGWLYRLLEDESDLRPGDVTLTELDPLIDSSNATPESWQAIIDDLWSHHHSADAFVVLHGTDTMAFTAAALSYALTDFGKPVILTGSQHPLGNIVSDATANVTGAINAALSGKARGVTLFFGHHLFVGNRVTKRSSWAFEGFEAPSTGPVAQSGTPWHWAHIDMGGRGWDTPRPYGRHDVPVITFVPGVRAQRLVCMVDPRPEAVVLRTYGVGNIPSDEPGMSSLIADLTDCGIPVVVTSQCPQAEVMVGRYGAGAAMDRKGVCGSDDMTFEATYTKLMFLLSQGLETPDVCRWMTSSIAGELTEGGR